MKSPILKQTDKHFSYFSFISDYWMAKESGWDRAFHRLCSLMRKMKAQSVVIEEIEYTDEKISAEYTALKTYYQKSIKIQALRFTFLSQKVERLSDIKKLGNEKFLSSSILINFKDAEKKWHSYLYESVVCTPKLSERPILNNYIHIHRDFNCSVHLGRGRIHSFIINGTYFCQQNSATSVCAHASLCMIINNMTRPGLDMISTEWINRTLGIDHVIKRVGPERGLKEQEVKQVLDKAGLKANWHNFFDDPNSDYAEYVYRYIEGRCPSLLIFSTHHSDALHVVPVLGHTLNSDIWKAEAELAYHKRVHLHYRPASEWVDHFIIHDDNFGMYLCLPVSSLRKITLPKHDPTFRAYVAIAITPVEVPTPAREAELAAALLIRSLLKRVSGVSRLGIWLERLADKRTPMVIRTLLMNKTQYEKHLRTNEDFESIAFSATEIIAMTERLPDYFWLSEVTLPDLYTANKSKIVDVIYGCDKPAAITDKEISSRWLQIRLPGACYFNTTVSPAIPLSVASHYPLFRHEKDLKMSEW